MIIDNDPCRVTEDLNEYHREIDYDNQEQERDIDHEYEVSEILPMSMKCGECRLEWIDASRFSANIKKYLSRS